GRSEQDSLYRVRHGHAVATDSISKATFASSAGIDTSHMSLITWALVTKSSHSSNSNAEPAIRNPNMNTFALQTLQEVLRGPYRRCAAEFESGTWHRPALRGLRPGAGTSTTSNSLVYSVFEESQKQHIVGMVCCGPPEDPPAGQCG